MRLFQRVFTILAVLMGGLFGLGATVAAADPATTPSSDPISDDYSPWAWMKAWDPVSAADAYNAVIAGEVHDGLNKTGMVIAAKPEQYSALTPDDLVKLDTAWTNGGLMSKTFARAQQWSRVALSAPTQVPEWSAADSDAAARDLGGTSYSALSPGLKSVAQRIATIVTGDFKPSMPDDAWASWMPADVRAAFDARPDQRFDWSRVSVTVDGSAAVTEVCDAGALNWVCQTTRAAASAAGAAVDFATDPLGWLTAKMAAGASGLMGWVSGVANHATAPDLTVAWWIDAYKKGMAIGIILFAMVLMWQLMQKSRGRIDAQELMETFTIWAPAYFLGVIFGPPLAQFFIVGSGYLSDGLVNSLTGFSSADAADQVGSAIDGAGAGTILGGTALTGGKGNVGGIFAAVLVISIIENLMNLFGVPPSIRQVVFGAVMLLAIYLASLQERLRHSRLEA